MPDFLKKKQDESNQNNKSDLAGLMSMDATKFNLGVQQSNNQGNQGGGFAQNPFDDFGKQNPSQNALASQFSYNNYSNTNQESNKDEFGDLFSKDWLKSSNNSNVKKKVDSYAYNPVDLNSVQKAAPVNQAP